MITILFYLVLLLVAGYAYFCLYFEKAKEDELLLELDELSYRLEQTKRNRELTETQYKDFMLTESSFYSHNHDEKLGLTIVKTKPYYSDKIEQQTRVRNVSFASNIDSKSEEKIA